MISINKTKWNIIKELSKGNKTPSQIAKKLRLTMPSIHLQLKGLERERLIKKSGSVNGKTRPFAEYSIGNGFVYFIKALPNETEQRFLHAKEKLELKTSSKESNILNKEIIIQKIEENREKIKSFGVKKLTLIGSYAHDEAKAESDIDFLVEFENGRGLFDDYVHLLQYLRDLFGKKIDLVKPPLIREELKESILGGKKIEAKI